ncbi:MAG TPA: cysteine-rich small domain-containing protein [Methanocorpusculum sp.]|nr:cysteine-rich small domain-containing protein [Methanocorpusculum sp.]
MRYYYTPDTLFVRGVFKAVTADSGNISRISTIFLHAGNTNPADVLKEKKYGTDADGFFIGAPLKNLCILQFDYISVFISASEGKSPQVIIISDEGMSDAALADAVKTAGTKCCIAAVPADAEPQHISAASDSETGSRIVSAVQFGEKEALKENSGREPRYFIYSRYENNGWFEWKRDGCPYYPCHFEGQVCQFCYCPFYPCKDESLGEWYDSTSLKRAVWACTNCTFLHEKKYADYLITHPDADFDEVRKA